MKLTKQTFAAKKEAFSPDSKKWVLIDAKDKTLGKISVIISNRLRGKDRPEFTPHVDTGDFIVVINADSIKLSGKKLDDKVYYKHSGYIGNIRSFTARELLVKNPSEILRLSVLRMLPKNKLSNHLITKLKIYAGSEHPHKAQMPTPIEV